jgi:CTD small phosphatase-like protein 2
VNGEAVAFHVRDLIHQQPPQKSPSAVAAAATATPLVSRNQPVTNRSYDSDMIVILDMDECLIHSQFLSSNAQSYAHQLKQKRIHQHLQPVDNFRFALPDGEMVHVNLRPGLQDFLKAVTDRFETHVFTAAMQVYAKPLLDHLDPNGAMFAGRWYREHCSFDPRQGAYVKNLTKLPLPVDLDRVVLVDNNPLSFLANPSNGILVSSFYNDPTDASLASVWELLQELDDSHDVRPLLEERFGLKQALHEIQQASKL